LFRLIFSGEIQTIIAFANTIMIPGIS